MTIASWSLTYLAALVAFLVVDLTWLGVIAQPLYQRHMGPIMLDSPRWGVALVFYAVYVAGLLFFAVNPVLQAADGGSVLRVMAMGAAFGFVTYATFDLTTLSVIRGYNGTIAVIDMVWGTVLGSIVATVGYAVASRLG